MSGLSTPGLPERITISSEVLYQEVEGQAVLLHLERERYYSLDRVGTKIWGMLGERMDACSIRDRMLSLYEVDERTLTDDLAAFIAKLAAAGLVTVDQ